MIGRVFWLGALERLAPDLDVSMLIDSLVKRDLIASEERSTISGDRAYQFKHLLIHDVAYAAMTKEARAENHQIFAHWLRERASEELVEIRAFHLDRASTLLTELDGGVPEELANEAARCSRVPATAPAVETRSPMRDGSINARWSWHRRSTATTWPQRRPSNWASSASLPRRWSSCSRRRAKPARDGSRGAR